MQEEHKQGNVVGLDVSTGEALDPVMAGIFDNYLVKKQILQSAPVVASQLLLVDEVMRAGETEKARIQVFLMLLCKWFAGLVNTQSRNEGSGCGEPNGLRYEDHFLWCLQV